MNFNVKDLFAPTSANYVPTMDAMMRSGKLGAVMPGIPGVAYGPGMDAAGASGGMVFLVGQLEKQDPRLLEPMTSVTGPRDVDMIPGGGWTALTSNVFVNYTTTASDEDSIIGSETSNIPVSQADITKDVWPVHTFSEILRAPLFDELKLQQVGKSLTQILDDGVRLNAAKLLDRNIYVGISKTKTYGLVNNPLVTSSLAPNGASGSPLWANKTPVEIMADLNNLLNLTWTASGFDLTGMANRILIDPINWKLLQQPVTIGGSISTLKYFLENNVAVQQGQEVKIAPLPWCIGAGVGSTNRIVAYAKATNRVNLDLTVPLSRVMTAPNTTSASYETIFAAQWSALKILAYTAMYYYDGV